jgi:prepilin-type N-terminal cleavage/methylation domain-containing protein
MLSLRAHQLLADRRRRSRGMTLVEVLIVLAISALLIGGVRDRARRGASGRGLARDQPARQHRPLRLQQGPRHRQLLPPAHQARRQLVLDAARRRSHVPARDRPLRPHQGRRPEPREGARRARPPGRGELQPLAPGARARGGQGPLGRQGRRPGDRPAAGRQAVPPAEQAGAAPASRACPASRRLAQPGRHRAKPARQVRGAAKKVPRRKPPIFGAFDDDNSLSELKKPFKLPKTDQGRQRPDRRRHQADHQGRGQHLLLPAGPHPARPHPGRGDREPGERVHDHHPAADRPRRGQEGKIDLALTDDPNSVKDDLGRRQTRRSF